MKLFVFKMRWTVCKINCRVKDCFRAADDEICLVAAFISRLSSFFWQLFWSTCGERIPISFLVVNISMYWVNKLVKNFQAKLNFVILTLEHFLFLFLLSDYRFPLISLKVWENIFFWKFFSDIHLNCLLILKYAKKPLLYP